jgi:hypothetical protein
MEGVVAVGAGGTTRAPRREPQNTSSRTVERTGRMVGPAEMVCTTRCVPTRKTGIPEAASQDPSPVPRR